ncbi:helix-turn-helix domain-containing protein [Aquimarina sp. AU474]|uniref:helix-turn-helix domain-containing protein n=1 Tax=Aquimarina sp. AU474 TaxID=2108529 RepID=UPI000D691CE9|nr:helix-turn-helix domain-containing protein [Aquimarina sp. AU474]
MKNIYRVFVWCVCLTFFNILYVNAQAQKKIKPPILDSLEDKSFGELYILYQKHNQDSIIVHEISNAYLFKGMKQKDTIEMAKAYRLKSKIHQQKNAEIALKYTDSILFITKNIRHDTYPAAGYLLRGYLLYNMERYDEALQSYLLTKKYAELNENEEQVVAVKHNMALLKATLGKHDEALQVFKENYNFLIHQDTIKLYPKTYTATLYKLADTYNRFRQYDSAYYYIKKGIRFSLSHTNQYYYRGFLVINGVNSYYRQEYQKAFDSLQKMLTISKGNLLSSNSNVRISRLFMAKTLYKLGKDEEALQYLQKIDSTTNKANYVSELRNTFTLLIEHYKKNEDLKNQLQTTNKLLSYEREYNRKYATLNNNIVKKYDIAELINDKNQLIYTIDHNNKLSKYKLWFLTLVLMILIGFLYFYYKKGKLKYKEVSNKYMQLTKTIEQKKEKRINSVEVPIEIKKEILKKLEDFQHNHKYLKNDLSLNSVSKTLKTNSSYLSKVINIDKQKSFNNYINDLRIEYCVDQIKNNKQFKQYSVRSMAGEVGFNNIQSFAKAFYKKMGCKPAEYIKNACSQ